MITVVEAVRIIGYLTQCLHSVIHDIAAQQTGGPVGSSRSWYSQVRFLTIHMSNLFTSIFP